MQNSILKLSALVGVIAVGSLVVIQAQKGLEQQTNQTDAGNVLNTRLGSRPDS